MNKSYDLFNQLQLGYVVIESQRLQEWQRFFCDGLGLHLAEQGPNLLAFRIDQHQRRIIVTRGSAEDVVAIGLHLQSDQALNEVLQRIQQQGLSLSHSSAQEASARGVDNFRRLSGPKNMAIELFRSPLLTDAPLTMRSSGFVCGDSGMGHLAITSRFPEKMLAFWCELFDARVSDYIDENIAGMQLDITFLRFNERHHSIAVACTRGLRIDPIRTRVQHVNLLTNTMDDLANAFRRLKNLGFAMAHEIGQHPNDKELSFYVVTPSGFEWELGWNALTVDEANWEINKYKGISLWGHKPQHTGLFSFLKVNAGNLWRGIKSLFRTEYTPY